MSNTKLCRTRGLLEAEVERLRAEVVDIAVDYGTARMPSPVQRLEAEVERLKALLREVTQEADYDTEHTPGPWEVREGTVQLHVSARASTGWICTVGGSQYDKAKPVGTETERANAALIARAPEMAEEIERLKAENTRIA
jgi:uncharacterized small protein (DUF1192 family)